MIENIKILCQHKKYCFDTYETHSILYAKVSPSFFVLCIVLRSNLDLDENMIITDKLSKIRYLNVTKSYIIK